MRSNSVVSFVLGVLVGGAAVFLALRHFAGNNTVAAQAPAVCYSCFWEGYEPKLRTDLVEYFRQFNNPDSLIMADSHYVMWRLTGTPNCDIRGEYKNIAASDADAQRRYVANSVLGFGAEECGDNPKKPLLAAATAARDLGLASEAKLLQSIAQGDLKRTFAKTEITTDLTVPPGATAMVLGKSRIEVTADTRIVSQVDRVARDWISNQFRWNLSTAPITTPLGYHEGAVLGAILKGVPAKIRPAPSSIAVKNGDTWYASDETGAFRFALLPDKLLYPTTHVLKDVAWIEDTHGISALVPYAIETGAQLVVGCGDAQGKAEASYYLAQRGINVMFPGDRYQDLLIGYTGSGTLMGSAPIKEAEGKVVLGDQPIRIMLNETIFAQDTKKAFPMQYYDSPARYFRRLQHFVPQLKVNLVEVEDQDEIAKVIDAANAAHSHVIGVRVMTTAEDAVLRSWLAESSANRAFLFHSGLYPLAQPLFRDFPTQVGFGDLRPQFE